MEVNFVSRLASIGAILTKASEAEVKGGDAGESEIYPEFGNGLDGIDDDFMPDWFRGLAIEKDYV